MSFDVNNPPFGFTSLNQAIQTLIEVVFFAAAIATLFYLLYAGLRYITSGGDDKGTQAARTIVKNVIVGLILLASVFVIFQILVAAIPGLDQFLG